MSDKNTGRNDPCPCGSGKKFKNCCLLSKGGSGVKRKIKATWINPSGKKTVQHVDLMERTFGKAVEESQTPSFLIPETEETSSQGLSLSTSKDESESTKTD